MSSGAGKGILAILTVLIVVVLAISAYAAIETAATSSQISSLSSQSAQSSLLSQLSAQQSALQAQQAQIAKLQTQIGTLLLQVGTIYNKTAGIEAYGGVPTPPQGMVAVRWIIGQYERMSGVNFSVYSAAPNATFWATISLKPGQTCGNDVVQQLLYNKNVQYCSSQLLGKPLPDNTLFVKPGQTALVAFVVTSTSNVDQQFAAVPHTYTPDQYKGVGLATGVGEQCWCVAVNYPLAAHGTYIRVISVAIDPSTPPGTQVILNHVLYGPPGQTGQG